MPVKTELDPTDRRILRILGQDGRASYQAVADEIGLSRPAIMERVKRLEESGYIRGYRVQLDRAKVVAPDLEGVQEILRDLRGPNSQMNTRTTIVLSTLFEKPGFLATEPD